ncbi:MAG: ankyrin repeat domain-containing protein [Desulfosalsimonas sp.]
MSYPNRLILIPVFLCLFLLSADCSSGGNSADILRQAEEAVADRNYEQAKHYAREVLSIDPDNREADIILSYIEYEDEMLPGAFWEDDEEALRYLADIVYDINARDKRFNASVLVLAASQARAETVKYLLNAGADPHVTDETGLTPLMWAVKHFDQQEEKEEMVRALLEAGAKVNAESERGETPLSIAIQYRNNDDIISLLEGYGAIK